MENILEDIPELDSESISDLLLLVSLEVSVEDISSWSQEDRLEVINWATTEHLVASDRPLERIPIPHCLNQK